MKIAEMKEIAVSYENVTAFLHMSEVAEFEDLTGIECKPGYTFQVLANAVIAKYESKEITNKAASAAIEILKNASRPMTERYRREGSKVYEYNANGNSYEFIGNYSSKEFKALVEENGRFI